MKFKDHKPGDTLITNCSINGVRAGAKVRLVEYRPEGYKKSANVKASMATKAGVKPEMWVAEFLEGVVKKTRFNPDGNLPTKTFLLLEHMVSTAVN